MKKGYKIALGILGFYILFVITGPRYIAEESFGVLTKDDGIVLILGEYDTETEVFIPGESIKVRISEIDEMYVDENVVFGAYAYNEYNFLFYKFHRKPYFKVSQVWGEYKS